jgi:hypothetical protein
MTSSIQSEISTILSGINNAKSLMNSMPNVSDFANDRIVEAKKAYNVAEKAGDFAGMQAASELADSFRKLGGTIKATDPIPSFDVGTNYVPKDMLAMVHEGEAIIPKKYNNDSNGTVININNPILFNDRDADKLGNLLVRRLKAVGVT